MTELENIKKLISEFGISQRSIARKMGMNENTFRLKFNDKYPQYAFLVTDEVNEIDQLRNVISELAQKAVAI